MNPAFVRIGNRFFNLHAILWAEIEDNPKRMKLVYHMVSGSTSIDISLHEEEAEEMIRILDEHVRASK